MATTTEPIKAQALAYARRGFRVIALHGSRNGVCTCHLGAQCRTGGKHPIDNGWQTADRMTVDEIESTWTQHPEWNLGIATGRASGIFVVDIDPHAGGLESGKALAIEHRWSSDETYRVKTGSGGFHLYYRMPDWDLGNSVGKLAPGIDIRAIGGQVVAPPSVSTKGTYEIVHDVPIIDAPDWLLEAIRPTENTTRLTLGQGAAKTLADLPEAERARLEAYSKGAVAKETGRLAELGTKGWETPWNQTTYDVACNLLQLANSTWSTITRDDAYDIVFSNTPEREPGYTDDIVIRTIESAMKKIGDKETPLPDPPANEASWMDDPSIPGEGQAAEEAAGDRPPPAIEQVVHVFEGIPVNGDILDPLLATRRAAAQLGDEYSSACEVKPVSRPAEIELNSLIAMPDVAHGDTAPVDAWLSTAMRSGNPELFWQALGYILGGQDFWSTTIVMKGGGHLLAALCAALRPAVGDTEERLLFGVPVSTRDIEGAAVVLELESTPPPFDIVAMLPAILERAGRAIAEAVYDGGFASTADDDVEDSTDLDYRITVAQRARLGLKITDREQ
jgi:hypothetical protein